MASPNSQSTVSQTWLKANGGRADMGETKLFAAGKRGGLLSHLTQRWRRHFCSSSRSPELGSLGTAAWCSCCLQPHYSGGWRHFCSWQSASTESTLSAPTQKIAKIHQPLLGPLPGDTSRDFTEMPHRLRAFRVRFSVLCRCAAESSLDGENRATTRLLVDKQSPGEMSYSSCLATTSCRECIPAVWPH